MRRPPRSLAAGVAVLGLLLAACGSDDDAAGSTTAATGSPAPAVEGEITVFAAASLTAAFTDLGDAFMVEHPDAHVTFNFASSSDLVTQINEGAPADVYASADTNNMAKLTDAGGNAADPQMFATNTLEILVQPGNPKGITGLADLARDDVLYVTCDVETPIGKYAAQALDNAGVVATPASYEENVKAVVSKVTLGEADAGIVYVTDVTAAGADGEGVEIPADVNVQATFPVVATKEAPNPEGAQAFVDFVLSGPGQEILQSYGFGAP